MGYIYDLGYKMFSLVSCDLEPFMLKSDFVGSTIFYALPYETWGLNLNHTFYDEGSITFTARWLSQEGWFFLYFPNYPLTKNVLKIFSFFGGGSKIWSPLRVGPAKNDPTMTAYDHNFYYRFLSYSNNLTTLSYVTPSHGISLRANFFGGSALIVGFLHFSTCL